MTVSTPWFRTEPGALVWCPTSLAKWRATCVTICHSAIILCSRGLKVWPSLWTKVWLSDWRTCSYTKFSTVFTVLFSTVHRGLISKTHLHDGYRHPTRHLNGRQIWMDFAVGNRLEGSTVRFQGRTLQQPKFVGEEARDRGQYYSRKLRAALFELFAVAGDK